MKRDGTALVFEVRAADRRQSSPQPSKAERKLASRRNGHQDRWPKTLLRRAVDEEGEVLDFLVERRRCARSARRLLRKLLKKQSFAPKRIATDKLKSYSLTICKEWLCAVHEQGLRADNRAEYSHRPVRHQTVTQVSGTLCYPCLRYGQKGGWRCCQTNANRSPKSVNPVASGRKLKPFGHGASSRCHRHCEYDR